MRTHRLELTDEELDSLYCFLEGGDVYGQDHIDTLLSIDDKVKELLKTSEGEDDPNPPLDTSP